MHCGKGTKQRLLFSLELNVPLRDLKLQTKSVSGHTGSKKKAKILY